MKTIALAGLLAISAVAAHAQGPLCDTCGHVQAVTKETRKGQGGAVGASGCAGSIEDPAHGWLKLRQRLRKSAAGQSGSHRWLRTN